MKKLNKPLETQVNTYFAPHCDLYVVYQESQINGPDLNSRTDLVKKLYCYNVAESHLVLQRTESNNYFSYNKGFSFFFSVYTSYMNHNDKQPLREPNVVLIKGTTYGVG